MRPEDVPAEWVEVADEAAWKAGNPLATLDVMPVWMREIGNRRMRAALAVVAPMIAKAEREACARVAEGAPYRERYRTWPWWANPDGSQGNRDVESDVVKHADKIAAAIRARSTEEGQ